MILDRKEREFLSTLSLRRATGTLPSHRPRVQHFYPRSPCGERQCTRRLHPSPADTHFYPRSPCGERLPVMHWQTCASGFLSTLSLRRDATPEKSESLTTYFISIHALLAESDVFLQSPLPRCKSISIHALPCGERQQRHRNKLSRNHNFYPRSPLRRATASILCTSNKYE